MSIPPEPSDRPLLVALTLLLATMTIAARGRPIQRVRIARPVVARGSHAAIRRRSHP